MEDPQRPLPPRSTRDRIRAWIGWIGFGRIVGSAIAMVIVCAGAYWLVRTPAPPTEASLPLVSTSVVSRAVAAPTPSQEPTVASAEAATTMDLLPVVVHVAGAVVTPGVYELPAGSRVEGAIAAAGGAMVGADPNALNLASPVIDGTRIYVPLVGEEVVATVAVAPASALGVDVPLMVDVNQATAAELEELPGVGPATATAIVTERERNGPFLSVDDLDRVPGIGPAKIEALREMVIT